MKSTTRTFGIIWGVLSLILFLVLIIVSTTLSAGKDAAIQTLVDGGMSVEAPTEIINIMIGIIVFFTALPGVTPMLANMLAKKRKEKEAAAAVSTGKEA